MSRACVFLPVFLFTAATSSVAVSQTTPIIKVRPTNGTLLGQVAFHPQQPGDVFAQVQVSSDSNGHSGRIQTVLKTDSTGAFVIHGVLPGMYHVVARSLGRAPARARLLVGSTGLRLLTLVLEEQVMTLEDFAPPEPQAVAIGIDGQVFTNVAECPLPSGMVVTALAGNAVGRVRVASVDTMGRFHFEGFEDGLWALTLSRGLRTVASQSLVVPFATSRAGVLVRHIRLQAYCLDRRT